MKNLSPYRKKALTVFFAVNFGLLAVSVVFLLLSDLLRGFGLSGCVFKDLFHLYCPGCGGTRSIYHLLHFDFYSSLKAYPPMAFILYFYIDLNLRGILSIMHDEPTPVRDFNMNYLILLPVVIIINFIINNLLLLFGIDRLGDLSKFYNLI